MYMPLCRGCHALKSKENEKNIFEGDASKIFVDIENKQSTANIAKEVAKNTVLEGNGELKTPSTFSSTK